MLLLLILAVYGVVIESADNGGNIFMNDENGKLITPTPTNDMLTEALKHGGNLLGFYQSVDSRGHAYFVEKFDFECDECVLEYYIKFDFSGNPVKIAVYLSNDLEDWKLLKEDVASVGWHRIELSNVKNFYIKFEALEPLDSMGSSLIDEVHIVEGKLSPLYKFDFTSMQVMIAGKWVSVTWIAIIFLASLLGASLTSKRRAIIFAPLAFVIPFTLDLIFDLKIYLLAALFENPYALIVDSFIFGSLFGLLSKAK